MKTKALATLSVAIFFVSVLIGCNFQKGPAQSGNGTLQIKSLGLGRPDGLRIRVQGEGNYFYTTTKPEVSIKVKPGFYVVQSNAVAVGRDLYVPNSFAFVAKVVSGKKTLVEFRYKDRGTYSVSAAQGSVILPLGSVKAVDAESVLLDKSLVGPLAPGQIIIYEGDAHFPKGLLRRVLSVKNISSGIYLSTKPATLEEGFSELEIQLEKPLTQWEYASSLVRFVNGVADLDLLLQAYQQRKLTSQTINRLPIITPSNHSVVAKQDVTTTISAPFKIKKEILDNNAEVGISGKLGVDVDISVSLQNKHLETLRLDTSWFASLAAKLSLSPEVDTKANSKEQKDVLTLTFGTWPIGVITVSPKVHAGYDAGLKVESGDTAPDEAVTLISSSYSTSVGTWFEYSKTGGISAGFSGYPSIERKVSVLDMDVAASSNLKLAASLKPELKLELKFYEIIGPYAGIDFGPEGQVDLACSSDPWWSLSLTSDFVGGIKIGFGSFSIDPHFSKNILTIPLMRADPVFTINKNSFSLTAGDTAKVSLTPTSRFCLGDTIDISLNRPLNVSPGEMNVVPDELPPSGGDISILTSLTLHAGTYSPTLHVESTRMGILTTSREFPIVVSVSAVPKPIWEAEPASLSVTGTVGGPSPTPKSVTLSNVGTGTGSFTLNTNSPWLHATAPTHTLAPDAKTTVTVSVDACGANDPASSNGTVTIGGDAPAISVAVARHCSNAPSPLIRSEPSSISFNNGGGLHKDIRIYNDGDADLVIDSFSPGVDWLDAPSNQSFESIPPGGSQEYALTASCAHLGPGNYHGNVIINSNAANGSAYSVSVNLSCAAGSYGMDVMDAGGNYLDGSYRGIAYWPDDYSVAAGVTSDNNSIDFGARLTAGDSYIFEIYHTPPSSDVVSWTNPLEEYWGSFSDEVPVSYSGYKRFQRSNPMLGSSVSEPPSTVSVSYPWELDKYVENNTANLDVRLVLRVRYLGNDTYCQPCVVTGQQSTNGSVAAQFYPEKAGRYEAVVSLEAKINNDWVTVDQSSSTPLQFSAIAPDISATPSPLELYNAVTLYPSSDLTIHNNGTSDLAITGVTASPAWLSVNASSRTIPPGSSYAYSVQGSCNHKRPGAYSGNVIVNSNDPDNNPLTIPVNMHCDSGNISIDIRNVGASIVGGKYKVDAYWNDNGSFVDWVARLSNVVDFNGLLTGAGSYLFEVHHTPASSDVPSWLGPLEELWGSTVETVPAGLSTTVTFERGWPYLSGIEGSPPSSVSVGSAWSLRVNTSRNRVTTPVRLRIYLKNESDPDGCSPPSCTTHGDPVEAGGIAQASFTPEQPGTYKVTAVLEASSGGTWVVVDQWGANQTISFNAN